MEGTSPLTQHCAVAAAGLLLSYLNVATTCWCMTICLVPHFERLLLDFSAVVSVASVGSLALFINLIGATGLAVQRSFLGTVLAYVSCALLGALIC